MQSSVRPGVDDNEPNTAREGTIWMCGACGKTNKDRYQVGDESCYMHAVLVHVNSIVRDETGRAISAEAVNDPDAQLTW
jgi:hypothetical protein